MDVQADVSHVVYVLAGDETDDFTDLAFGVCRDMRENVSELTFFSLLSSVT